MWKKLAELYGWTTPAEEIEKLTPSMDALYQSARKSLDRDLSTTDPAFVFLPALEPDSTRK